MNALQLRDALWLTGALLAISSITFAVTWIIAWVVACCRDRFTIAGWSERDRATSLLWMGLPLAFVAITIGYLTGNSREPAVNALVPAILGLFSAGMIVLLPKREDVLWPVGMSIILLTANLMLGSTMGAIVRDNLASHKLSLEFRAFEAEREADVNAYRKEVGLAPLPPGGKTLSSDKK